VRVLVTGGAGFIGSAVVDALLARGDEVRVLDNLHPVSHDGPPDYLHPDAEYRWGDVRDPAAAAAAVDGVDAVCHQASMVGLGVDFADVADYVAHNDLGTATLLRALHDRAFDGRLVLASSMVVYGEGRYRCARHGVVRPGPRHVEHLEAGDYEPRCPDCGDALTPTPVPEDAPVDPRNVYAATKLHQEHLGAAYGREHGASVIALRYHNVYGPRMPRDTPYAGVASIFRSAYERAEAPRVFEDGGQTRDFVHVADVARANLAALDAAPSAAGAHNVASGRPRTVGEMAVALGRAFGRGAPPPQVVGGYRLGDVRHVFASTERAAEVLGFRASIGFEDGMAEFATAPLRRRRAGR
jgi:dTDP-L-rhamnose 4-epimerase